MTRNRYGSLRDARTEIRPVSRRFGAGQGVGRKARPMRRLGYICTLAPLTLLTHCAQPPSRAPKDSVPIS